MRRLLCATERLKVRRWGVCVRVARSCRHAHQSMCRGERPGRYMSRLREREIENPNAYSIFDMAIVAELTLSPIASDLCEGRQKCGGVQELEIGSRRRLCNRFLWTQQGGEGGWKSRSRAFRAGRDSVSEACAPVQTHSPTVLEESWPFQSNPCPMRTMKPRKPGRPAVLRRKHNHPPCVIENTRKVNTRDSVSEA